MKSLALALLLGATPLGAAESLPQVPYAEARPAIHTGDAVLINGRRVSPAGQLLRTQSYNFGMVVSADERTAVLTTMGTLDIVHLGASPSVERFPAYGAKRPDWMGCCSYMGLALSADGKRLYLGDTYAGRIVIMDLPGKSFLGEIRLNQKPWEDSYPTDLALAADESKLWTLDQANYRLVEIDLLQRRVARSVKVGRAPFALKLDAEERNAWVTNVGMFEYPLLPGITPKNWGRRGLQFPAYGVPSREAEEGTRAEGLKVPGLGSPNHPDAMAVFRVDLASASVTARIKTGYRVGADREGLKTVGGASPAAVAVGRTEVYVSNATNDTISVIDAASGSVTAQIELEVPGLRRLRGVLPFGLALSPDGSRLYAACAGLNAVAVMDPAARSLMGYIPAGWFCSNVAVSKDGRRLFVSSAKGLGSGPNGGEGFVAPRRGSHPGEIMQGLFQVIPAPSARRLAAYTREVLANTFKQAPLKDDGRNPLPPRSGLRKSPIQHLIFIVKENRSFDEIFGQRPGVLGQPGMARFGLSQTIKGSDGASLLAEVDITPNHQALAARFAISDNFYCDSDQSNTGHRWVAGVYPNEWVEVNAKNWMEEKVFSSAPGRRYVAGSSAAVFPEDYNEAGSLWEHLYRNGISFFNFGFGTELPASIESRLEKETGIRMSVSFPLPKPLFERSSRHYPTYNMAIPDQYRVDQFEKELAQRWESGKEPFPRLITIVLPQDHTADPAPADGYPFVESYVADNDLALGRVLETLSHSRWWKEMLVVVVEDDPQGGRDHVEAHRSVMMLLGPWVRRGAVSHTLCDFGSVMRTLFTLLDLPPLNQFDATAALPRDAFSDVPDFEAYQALLPDKRLFDPDKALKPFQRRFNWKRLAQSPVMDNPDDMRKGFEDD